jgi:hypothetical protein
MDCGRNIWTVADEEFLLTLINDNRTMEAITRNLKKCEWDIRAKIDALALRFLDEGSTMNQVMENTGLREFEIQRLVAKRAERLNWASASAAASAKASLGSKFNPISMPPPMPVDYNAVLDNRDMLRLSLFEIRQRVDECLARLT